MTIIEIKQAINAGHAVELFDGAYEVIKDEIGQFLIHCKCNDNYIGLHGREGTEYVNQLNYPNKAFYIVS